MNNVECAFEESWECDESVFVYLQAAEQQQVAPMYVNVLYLTATASDYKRVFTNIFLRISCLKDEKLVLYKWKQ